MCSAVAGLRRCTCSDNFETVENSCEAGKKIFLLICFTIFKSTLFKQNAVKPCEISAASPVSFNGGFIRYQLKRSFVKSLLFRPIDPTTVVNSDDLFPVIRGRRAAIRQGKSRSAKMRFAPPNTLPLLPYHDGNMRDSSHEIGRSVFDTETAAGNNYLKRSDVFNPPMAVASVRATNYIEIDFRTLNENGLIFFAAFSKSDFYIVDVRLLTFTKITFCT